jgi:DNA primase
MIKPESIEALREKADIVQIISDYVPLKKRGKNFLGLCPFHSEKTASFTVSPEKNLFHCFGCHEGGNLFSFVMRMENVEFAEACEIIAEKTNFSLEYTAGTGRSTSHTPSGTPKTKDRYLAIMALAAKYYHENLKSAESYLKKRDINEKMQKDFLLGTAPDNWDDLYNFLIGKGYSPVDIEAVGLAIPRENRTGAYDRFRNRLVFPIFDLRGKPIGFSGRALDEKQDPKYLNSPDTPIFNKGHLLFGMHLAKEAIKRLKYAILVEGNVDVVRCHQVGAANTVAPLGTMLTSDQARLLARLTDTVIIAFDSDTAGLAAAARAVDILKNEGLLVKIASLGKFKDPDELIQSEGPEGFSAALKSALGWIEFRLERLLLGKVLNSIDDRSKAAREAAQLISQERDELARNQYLRTYATKIKIDLDDFKSEVARNLTQAKYNVDRGPGKKSFTKPASAEEEAQKKILQAITENTALLAETKKVLEPDDFTNPDLKAIYEKMLECPNETGSILNYLMDTLPEESHKKALTEIMVVEGEIKNPEKALSDCLGIMLSSRLKRKLAGLKSDLQEAEKTGNIELAKKITEEYNAAYGQLRSFSNTSA